MIHEIASSLGSFKTLTFRDGLNILLADTHPGASERQTRNAVGKTSLVELLHFLTGADVPRGSIFRHPLLCDHTFSMSFDLGGRTVSVERSVDARVRVHEGTVHGSEAQVVREVSNAAWREKLSDDMGLPGRRVREEAVPFGPRFRALYSYFVRRQSSGGFEDPVKNASQQQLGDRQVSVSFLLGLDWKLPARLEGIRARERMIKEVLRAGAAGVLGEVVGRAGELRTRLLVAEEKIRVLREEIAKFRVHAEYETLQWEIGQLNERIDALSNDTVIDRQLLRAIAAASREESMPGGTDLETAYREAGVVFPGEVMRRYEEVAAFHASVVRNRRLYLEDQGRELQQRVQDRSVELGRAVDRRDELMRVLSTHGALGHFVELEAEAARAAHDVSRLRSQYQVASQLEGESARFDFERARIRQALLEDYIEREAVLRSGIVAFETVSRRMYEHTGSLRIEAGANGPLIDIVIQGDRSKGITNMQIFCFDMMMMQLAAESGVGPGYLVHDSHLFDGVDERQVRVALLLGQELAARFGFQYVVTLNSDAFPGALRADPRVEGCIMPVRLTDEGEGGGLFGVRF